MDAARRALILEATKGLNPETDFTKTGQPNMTALKGLVPDITSDERDELWPVQKAGKSEDTEATPAAGQPGQEKTIITGEDALKNMREKGYRV